VDAPRVSAPQHAQRTPRGPRLLPYHKSGRTSPSSQRFVSRSAPPLSHSLTLSLSLARRTHLDSRHALSLALSLARRLSLTCTCTRAPCQRLMWWRSCAPKPSSLSTALALARASEPKVAHGTLRRRQERLVMTRPLLRQRAVITIAVAVSDGVPAPVLKRRREGRLDACEKLR